MGKFVLLKSWTAGRRIKFSDDKAAEESKGRHGHVCSTSRNKFPILMSVMTPQLPILKSHCVTTEAELKHRPVWRPSSSLDEGQQLKHVSSLNEPFNWSFFIWSMCLGKTLLLACISWLTVNVSSSSPESTSVITRRNSRHMFKKNSETAFHSQFCFPSFS